MFGTIGVLSVTKRKKETTTIRMVIKECVLEGTLSTIGNLNVNYGFAGKIAFAQIN